MKIIPPNDQILLVNNSSDIKDALYLKDQTYLVSTCCPNLIIDYGYLIPFFHRKILNQFKLTLIGIASDEIEEVWETKIR